MAAEIDSFIVELGRASKRSARLLRGLSRADADDVLGAALLAAWEQRGTVGTDVNAWFTGLLRTARDELSTSRGGRLRLATTASQDDTERAAALAELTERIDAELDDNDKPLLDLYAGGYTCAEIAARIHGTPTFVRRRLRSIRNRIGPLRKWMPDLSIAIAQPTAPPEDAEAPPIDHEIEKLLRRPAHRTADCPVCWRCSWFEGLAPPKHFSLNGVDERKREIALAVRCGKL